MPQQSAEKSFIESDQKNGTTSLSTSYCYQGCHALQNGDIFDTIQYKLIERHTSLSESEVLMAMSREVCMLWQIKTS